MPMSSHIEPYTDFAASIPRALDAIGAAAVLKDRECIVLKPNLVNASPPPVTFPASAAAALLGYVRDCSRARLVIAEGCGEPDVETGELFSRHGYADLARRYGAELVDLNHTPALKLENPGYQVFPHFMMPRIIMEGFLISAAVLKAHSLADVTLAMKNLIGCAPPAHYQQGGYWRKSAFHGRMHEAIFELNRYRKPDLSLLDGSVGMAEHHLGGPTCDPPVRRIVAGFDPVAVDAVGASLLGRDWRCVEHIRLADGVLGAAGAVDGKAPGGQATHKRAERS
jgi:uncharacterized protein (DUF362 family)